MTTALSQTIFKLYRMLVLLARQTVNILTPPWMLGVPLLIERIFRLKRSLITVMDIVENLLHSLFVLGKRTAELKAAIPPRPKHIKKTP